MDPKEIPRIWEFKQAADSNVLELYIYGDVKAGYYDWWNGKYVESENVGRVLQRGTCQIPECI